MIRTFIILFILTILASCATKDSTNLAAESHTKKSKSIASIIDAMRQGKYLTPLQIKSYIEQTGATIRNSTKGRPFDSIAYNKVIAYEFDGEEPSFSSIITNDGNFVLVVTKQRALSQKEVDDFTRLLSQSSTYGNGTAACFIPHLGLVFLQDNTIVMHISICLGCNAMNSSVDIPAQFENKINAGTENEYPATGFSKPARSTLKKICDSFDYRYEKSTLFDE